MDAPLILSIATESTIVFMITQLAEWGFGLNYLQVLALVTVYLVTSQQTDLFRNGTPTIEWYRGFRTRNPDLRLRKAQNMPSAREKAPDPKIIENNMTNIT